MGLVFIFHQYLNDYNNINNHKYVFKNIFCALDMDK